MGEHNTRLGLLTDHHPGYDTEFYEHIHTRHRSHAIVYAGTTAAVVLVCCVSSGLVLACNLAMYKQASSGFALLAALEFVVCEMSSYNIIFYSEILFHLLLPYISYTPGVHVLQQYHIILHTE